MPPAGKKYFLREPSVRMALKSRQMSVKKREKKKGKKSLVFPQ
jgi:hypothetical protein